MDANGNGADRLDSWKAIADYLNRDVATARRWEKSLGLPVRRVAGAGRSVFAYKAEIDAWLRTAPAGTQPDVVARSEDPVSFPSGRPPAVARRHPSVAVAIAAVAIAIVSLGVRAVWDLRRPPIVRLDLSSAGLVAWDAAGEERWRHIFPDDTLALINEIGPNTLIVPGPNPAAYAVVSYTARRADQLAASGSLLEFSIGGRLRRSFSFDDEHRFRGQKFVAPWAATTLAVDDSSGSRRIAVAAHHFNWDPSLVTILDDQWRRTGTFVHAGWIEALHWIAPDRLLIGGYSESREGGMVALLDPAHMTGQGPEEPGSRYWCEDCGGDLPLRMIVMPRTEVNRAAAWRFNRAFVTRLEDRIVAHTIELEQTGGHAEVVYEFTPTLDLVSASFSDRYWDAHRSLEAQGKLTHTRAECPDRAGPRSVLVWDAAAGWRTLAVVDR